MLAQESSLSKAKETITQVLPPTSTQFNDFDFTPKSRISCTDYGFIDQNIKSRRSSFQAMFETLETPMKTDFQTLTDQNSHTRYNSFEDDFFIPQALSLDVDTFEDFKLSQHLSFAR